MSFAEPQLRVKKAPPPIPQATTSDYDKAAIKECNNRHPPSTSITESVQSEVSFEVIKDGVQAGMFNFDAADFLAIGRQPPDNELARNFLHMEHPSLSRRHAIILRNRRTSQVFVYDQGSTHGTQLNYKPLKGFQYYELADGDILRFGESTRMVVVHIDSAQSSSEDENQE